MSMWTWQELAEEHAGPFDAKRKAAALDIIKTSGMSAPTLTTSACTAKINGYDVAVGFDSDLELVLSCTCADRKHRGGACKHIIALVAVADGRKIVPVHPNAGYDVQGVLTHLRQPFSGVSDRGIVYSALVLMDKCVNDTSTGQALEDIMQRYGFDTIEEAVAWAICQAAK